jgi:cell division protein FtsI (penicillin-binding protein 3)
MLGVVPDAQHDIDVADMMPLIWQETPPKQANGN